jgi:hypothetical protein
MKASPKQYVLSDKQLVLSVKKSPLFVRATLFILAFLFFLAPIIGVIIGLFLGKSTIFGFFISILLFGLCGLYSLRSALWNTFGRETIKFTDDEINYEVDYGWFKDSKTTIKRPVEYAIEEIGYEEDNLGVLVIGLEDPNIFCATKMPIAELEELIDKLQNNENKSDFPFHYN